jgi:chemotaxis protein CheD
VLPHLAAAEAASARFANVAMRELIDALLRLGARRRSLQAKVFGGAGVTPTTGRPGAPQLGEQNVLRALAILKEERIPVVAADTGGSRGRKLIFDTGDGAVWLKAL